jgi:transposase
MPTQKRTHQFPPEFKTQAVQLALTSGKARHTVAQELGVGLSTLTKWIKQHHQNPHGVQPVSPVTGLTTHQALEQENRRLKRELEIVRQEREILKAATKFFAKENP